MMLTILSLLQMMRLTAATGYQALSGHDDLLGEPVPKARSATQKKQEVDDLVLGDIFRDDSWGIEGRISRGTNITRETRMSDTCFFITLLKKEDCSNFSVKVLSPTMSKFTDLPEHARWTDMWLKKYTKDLRARTILEEDVRVKLIYSNQRKHQKFLFEIGGEKKQYWWDQNSSCSFTCGPWDMKITLITNEEAVVIRRGEEVKENDPKKKYSKKIAEMSTTFTTRTKYLFQQRREELFTMRAIGDPRGSGIFTSGSTVACRKLDGVYEVVEVYEALLFAKLRRIDYVESNNAKELWLPKAPLEFLTLLRDGRSKRKTSSVKKTSLRRRSRSSNTPPKMRFEHVRTTEPSHLDDGLVRTTEPSHLDDTEIPFAKMH
jgi:hypothetical protein